MMDNFYYNGEIQHIAEICKNRLYFGVISGTAHKILRSTQETVYFSIDEELLYINYYSDFGPLNISCLYKYCCKVNNYICDQGIKRIVHYTTSDPNKRSNSAYLIGSFAVMYLNMEPREIYKILLNAGGVFRNFVDASQGISQYTIRLTDCLQAMAKAIQFNFVNFSDFNMIEYDMQDKLQNGDMNWLIPRKFLAFIGPTESEILNGHPPDFYLKYFLKNDVKTVIRLNSKAYDAMVFSDVGMDHHDLFFPDGTTPPKDVLLKFLIITENAPAAIAVHCKAGLGRTGSLIGAYIIKHYRMTAREAIAWMRICRPGSVIGQQQGWLEKVESWLWRQGSQYRLQHYGEGDKIPHHRYGIYSTEWPKERERLIKIAQKRKADAQSIKTFNSKLSNEAMQNYTNIPQQKKVFSASTEPVTSTRHHKFEKRSMLLDAREEEFRRISKLLNRVQDLGPLSQNNQSQTNNTNAPTSKKKDDDFENMKPRKKRSKSTIHVESDTAKVSAHQVQQTQGKFISFIPKKIDMINTKPNYSAQTQDGASRSNENRFRKHYFDVIDGGQIYTAVTHNKVHRSSAVNVENEYFDTTKGRRRTHTPDNMEMTQGDKLNSIKAQRRYKSCNYDNRHLDTNVRKQMSINACLKKSAPECIHNKYNQ